MEDQSLSLAPGPSPEGTLDGTSPVDCCVIPPRRPTADEDSVDREAPTNLYTPRTPDDPGPNCGKRPIVEDSRRQFNGRMVHGQHQWDPGHNQAQRMIAMEKPRRSTGPMLHSDPNYRKVAVLVHSQPQDHRPHPYDGRVNIMAPPRRFLPNPNRWDEGTGSEPTQSLSPINVRGPTPLGSSVDDSRQGQDDLVSALREKSMSTDSHSGIHPPSPWLQPVVSKNETSGPYPMSDYAQLRRRPQEPPVLPFVADEDQRQDEPQDQGETFVWWEYMKASCMEFAILYGKDVVLAFSIAANVAVGINHFLLPA